MTDFETYTLDQFPLRDSFRRAQGISLRWISCGSSTTTAYMQPAGMLAKLDYPVNTDLRPARGGAVFRRI